MKIAITWKKIAILLFFFLLFFASIELLVIKYQESPLYNLFRWFDLDREANLPVLFSTALLFLAGYTALYLSRKGRVKKLTGVLGYVLIFMGLDELLKIHETLEKITGVDWQILYVPVVLMAGLSWLSTTWNSRGMTRLLFVGGAFCWGLSQVLEAVQWGGFNGLDEKVAHYTIMMYVEEMLEMIGSSQFLLALSQILWPTGKGSIDIPIEDWTNDQNQASAISSPAGNLEKKLEMEDVYPLPKGK